MESLFDPSHRSGQELREALAQIDRDLEAERAQISQRVAQQRSAIGQLKGIRAALSDLAWEVEEIEQRLRDIQAQPEGPHDALVEREVASMLGQRAGLEEQLLAKMLAADELAAGIAAEEQSLAAAQSEWSARAAALQAERAQLAELLAHLQPNGE